MHIKLLFSFIVFYSLSFTTPLVAAVFIKPDLQQVLNYSNQSDLVDIIIDFSPKVNINKMKVQATNFQANYINALHQNSSNSQQELIQYLASKNIHNYSKLWMINSLAVTVEAQMIPDITAMVGVSRIRYDRKIQLDVISKGTQGTLGWNISQVNAPAVWVAGNTGGFTGQNVVIASLDTGVDINHVDLQSRFRGNTNSWFDPFTGSTTPYDLNGHGTSVMGVIVGGNDSGTSIGVAPGAKWISAKIFNDKGETQPSKIHLAYQWILNPDGISSTKDSPSVVNNSWNFEASSKTCDTEFQTDIISLYNAGIAVIFSSGNSGISLSPANNFRTISVGALDESLAVESFSGRGPSTCPGSGIYPNIVAPGTGIFTADLTGGGVVPKSYTFQTGTSFSAPHITGAFALLKSAFPASTLEERRKAISYSAIDLGQLGEDTSFGWGYLNIYGAYLTLDKIVNGLQLPTLPPVANNETIPLFKDSKSLIIDLLKNDFPDTRIDPANKLDLTSVVILSNPDATLGSITNTVNGIVTFTPVKGTYGNNRFSYTVKDIVGNESNVATVSIETADPIPTSGSGGGCTLQHQSRFDPILPIMLILSLWLFVIREIAKANKVERF